MSAVQPTEVEGVAYRFTAPNAGPKTLQGTNTYVVGRARAYVIDPGPDDDAHLASIVNWLRATDRIVAGILLTHAHPDHALGAPRLANTLHVPILAADAEPYDLYVTTDHIRLRRDSACVTDDDTLKTVSSPGHTPDSVCFFLERSRILFTGDTILGLGSTVVASPEGDMQSYMTSLDALSRLNPHRLAPGHGPVVEDARSRIAKYIEHRRARESQLVNALAEDPSTVAMLVTRLYVETPIELRELAGGSVQAGLQKLERENIARREGERWVLVNSTQ
jgi:glyoxylase-like metal-dependent hydrolase (beta-lactamase superfamily II)